MLGLAFLGNALAGLLGAILSWLGTAVVKRIAVIAAITAAVATLTFTLVTTLMGRVAEYAAAGNLPEFFQPMLAWLPSNTAGCFLTIVACESALWGYRFAMKFVFYRTAL